MREVHSHVPKAHRQGGRSLLVTFGMFGCGLTVLSVGGLFMLMRVSGNDVLSVIIAPSFAIRVDTFAFCTGMGVQSGCFFAPLLLLLIMP